MVMGPCQTSEIASKPGKVDEDVNIRNGRFAADLEWCVLHKEQSSVGKPIRGPQA